MRASLAIAFFLLLPRLCELEAQTSLKQRQSPEYKKLLEQLEPHKPENFQLPAEDSRIVGAWENRSTGFEKAYITFNPDGIGFLGASTFGSPFFWVQKGEAIELTFPIPENEPRPKDKWSISYIKKFDIVVVRNKSQPNKANKFFREGTIYGKHPDRPSYTPGKNKPLTLYEAWLYGFPHPELKQEKAISHGTMAFMLVDALDLNASKEIKTYEDAFKELEKQQIAPKGGWQDPSPSVSMGEFATLLVRAMGNPDHIDLNDPEACVEYLAKFGHMLSSVAEGIKFLTEYRQAQVENPSIREK